MGYYRVGKGEAYKAYLVECVRVMYGAGVVHFTLPELAEWAGLTNNASMRRVVDELVLEGFINVDYAEHIDPHHPRSYNLLTSAWFSTIEPD